MKHLLSLIDSSLPVAFRVFRANLAKLIAVFLPLNLFLSYLHAQAVNRFIYGADVPLSAVGSFRPVDTVFDLSIGLVAFVLIVRATWDAVARPTDRNEVFGDAREAWCRTFGSKLLTALAVCAALGSAVVAMLVCKTVYIAGVIAGLAVLCLGVIFCLRLWFAPFMSALFNLGPVESLKVAFRISRLMVRDLFLVIVFSAFVTLALNALPETLFCCDTLGFAHPFATDNGTLRLVAGVVRALLGTVIDIIGYLPVVVLTIFVHERLEGPDESRPVSVTRPVVLAAVGFVYIVIAVIGLSHKHASVNDNRAFRMENMDLRRSDVSAAFDISLFTLIGGKEVVGRAYIEKSPFLDFSKKRLLWYELPFCSKCGSCYWPASSGCERHENDTYAFKGLWIANENDYRPAVWFSGDVNVLLPTDVRRPMTDEEKARVNARLNAEDASNAAPRFINAR